jgi:hypothetical protein
VALVRGSLANEKGVSTLNDGGENGDRRHRESLVVQLGREI